MNTPREFCLWACLPVRLLFAELLPDTAIGLLPDAAADLLLDTATRLLALISGEC
jgi:hypothetical protein